MSPADKVNFALAAYDAGPAKITTLRQEAGKQGVNPNKWFFNVERVALREMGRETIRYVANIEKYFIAYKSAERVLKEKRTIRKRKEGETRAGSVQPGPVCSENPEPTSNCTCRQMLTKKMS
jgi:membrane-bound lytic murein transglycosylase MltF